MNVRQSLVGRDAELRRIEDRLAAAPGATIVVTGPFGTGKSTLVRAVRESAVDAGWVLVPQDRDAVVIGPDSTVQSASAAIKGDFEISVQRRNSGQGFVTPPYAADPGGDRSDSAVPSLLSGAQLAPHGSATDGGGVRLEAPQTGSTLITVDVQAPAPEGRDWLGRGGPRTCLGGQIESTVILTSDRLEDQTCLTPTADLVVALGPLERSAVLERLERTRPGLPSDELAAYADAISRDPTLLDSFLRLLPLIRAHRKKSERP